MAETFNQMIRFPKDLEPQIKAQAEKKRCKCKPVCYRCRDHSIATSTTADSDRATERNARDRL